MSTPMVKGRSGGWRSAAILVAPGVLAALLGLGMGKLTSTPTAASVLASLGQAAEAPELDASYWAQEQRMGSALWQAGLAKCLALGAAAGPNCEAVLALERLRATEQMARELKGRIEEAESTLDVLEQIAAESPIAAQVPGLREQRREIKEGAPAP